MSSMIASHARASGNDLPEYVRKFRLESNELKAIGQRPLPSRQMTSYALIWTKVAAMSVASTGLLYLAVLLIN